MEILLTVRNLTREPDWDAHLQHRLGHALDRIRHRVKRVRVWLDDINGPNRGGADKRVVLQADLGPLGQVRVEHVDAEPTTAIDHASRRLARAIVRQVRRRALVRAPMPPPAAAM